MSKSSPLPEDSAVAQCSVQKLLEALDADFRSICDGIASGGFAFWLGSGISRGRAADLQSLILKAITHLQRRRVLAPADANRFTRALEQIIDLAQLSPRDRDALDLDLPADRWTDLATILNRLAANYSKLLGIRIQGEPTDYLLWDAVDVRAEYANDDIGPDVEHFCLAILAIEGIATSLVTGNWDGLIERAVDELTAPTSSWALNTVVTPDDFRTQGDATLYKFHGCAVRAKAEEEKYREYLVGSEAQITRWSTSTQSQKMRARLTDLAGNLRTLIIGLSAQDANIRQVFSEATKDFNWPWPCDPPACVVAGSGIGSSQREVLEHLYGNAYDAGAVAEIEARSLIPAYAKQFLVALVLDVLCTKHMKLLEDILPTSFDANARAQLRNALQVMRVLIAPGPSSDLFEYTIALIDVTCHVLAIFRTGTSPRGTARYYQPVTTGPLGGMLADPNVPLSRLRELAVALATIGLGMLTGLWRVTVPEHVNPMAPSIELHTATVTVRGFIVADSEAATRLGMEGRMSEEDPGVLLIRGAAMGFAPTRSPRVPYGRVGRPSARLVSISDLLASVDSTGALLRLFAEQVSI